MDEESFEDGTVDCCGLLRLLCRLFCPPCPARIAAKIAFNPPPSTYNFTRGIHGYSLTLTENAGWQLSKEESNAIYVYYAETKTKNMIACAYINCNPDAKYTVLFSHSNAMDLGESIRFCIHLHFKTYRCCNFFVYDYSGYGVSTGWPSPKNICDDIDAAFHTMFRFGVDKKNVILLGLSIGSVPSIDLASKHDVGGLVLVAPLASGINTLFPSITRIWRCDPFPNLVRVKKVTCRVLLVHGYDDEIIPIAHSERILKALKKNKVQVMPLFVPGADHTSVAAMHQFYDGFFTFINFEFTQL